MILNATHFHMVPERLDADDEPGFFGGGGVYKENPPKPYMLVAGGWYLQTAVSPVVFMSYGMGCF